MVVLDVDTAYGIELIKNRAVLAENMCKSFVLPYFDASKGQLQV